MGCCLGEMVCNLTLARESSDDVTDLRETLWLIDGADRAEELIEALRKGDDRRAA